MRFIGITGGVGAGKTAILSYLREKPGVRVMLADEVAHMLMQPGTECFLKLKEAFDGEDIYSENKSFDREKLAAVIFSDDSRRARMNGIVHPAVKEYVKDQYRMEQSKGELSFLFLEAALLIEEHYDAICDELWYIYTSEENRRMRLKESRGYTEERLEGIFASQLKEEEYRRACSVVIDNNGTMEQSFEQIETALRREADE